MRRKAVLLTLRPDTTEMEELVFAVGADLVATVHQRRAQPDPQFFLGAGKAAEARDTVRAAGADLVVVNGSLKPGQIHKLQQFMSDGAGARDGASAVEVYDRTRLILEIFRERARSPEARLQVELAQLTYDMPLVKEAINLLKRGERPGFLAGGSYEVEQVQDMMRKRMARIRRDLEKMRRERGVRRKHRRRGGFHLVSLAGYTNAGKSSLLRALSERDTLVENRYFSTLVTKTARVRSDRREILVTDTVGFIEDLPPWMVEAFHSTLEEIALADVILLVLDASDPVEEMARRLRSSLRILWEFDRRDAGGAGPAAGEEARTALAPIRRAHAPLLVALNKMDRVSPEELARKRDALAAEGLLDPEASVAVSAATRQGLDALYARLYALIPDYDEYEVALPPSPEAETFLAWVHDHADVLDLTRGNEAHLHFEAKRSLRATILERLKATGATTLREVQRERSGGSPSGNGGNAGGDSVDGPVGGASPDGEAREGAGAKEGDEAADAEDPAGKAAGEEAREGSRSPKAEPSESR